MSAIPEKDHGVAQSDAARVDDLITQLLEQNPGMSHRRARLKAENRVHRYSLTYWIGSAAPYAVAVGLVGVAFLLSAGVLTPSAETRNDPQAIRTPLVHAPAPEAPAPAPAPSLAPTPVTAPTPPPESVPVNWNPFILAASGLVAVGGAAGAGYGGYRIIGTMRSHRKARALSESALRARWDAAERNLTVINAVYADFETDLAALLFDKPALADVTVPETSAFHRARNHAVTLRDTLRTETLLEANVTLFEKAVAEAGSAWDIASAHATKVAQQGRRTMSDGACKSFRVARKLVDTASDESTPKPAALSYLDRALSLLRAEGAWFNEDLVRTGVTLSLEKRHLKALDSVKGI